MSHMPSRIVDVPLTDWESAVTNHAWTAALEDGKVLHFPHLGFQVLETERALLSPELLAPGVRNISLGTDGRIKGVQGSQDTVNAVQLMVSRFKSRAEMLIDALFPHYCGHLRVAPTSFRPMRVQDRTQSWRADDKRLHVDAFPSRPNRGERILRVFANINPNGEPRVWRVGESFDDLASRLLPRTKAYVAWQALALNAMGVTKSLRSEYDHIMLQLHDAMKADEDYQKNSPQVTMPFAPGSVWICFSDQTAHAAMSGQYMLELTLHLAPEHQYWPQRSPLAVLQRLTGKTLL